MKLGIGMQTSIGEDLLPIMSLSLAPPLLSPAPWLQRPTQHSVLGAHQRAPISGSLAQLLSPPGIKGRPPDSHGLLFPSTLPSEFYSSDSFSLRPSLTSLLKFAPHAQVPIPFTLLYHFPVWMTLNPPQGWSIYNIHGLSPCTRIWVPGRRTE